MQLFENTRLLWFILSLGSSLLLSNGPLSAQADAFDELLDSLPEPLLNPYPYTHFPFEVEATTTETPSFEDRVMELVNQERWDNGELAPLKRNTLLDNAAETHSVNMATRNFFAHCDPDTGDNPGDRVAAAGYTGSGSAENIAAGYSSPESVMAGWMNSSGHRANILSTSRRELGIGYFYQSGDQGNINPDDNRDCVRDNDQIGPYYRYWTQNFGHRNEYYPVVVNREAYQTDSRNAELYLYGQGWATEMRLRNDNGSWTSWQAFSQDVPDWQLSVGNGVKQVFVEIRDGTGTVLSASDTIVLDGDESSDSVMLLGVADPDGQGWVAAIAASAPHDHQAWLQVEWPGYNTASGETHPVFCDVDGDSKPEVVIGLGAGSEGWLEIKDDAAAGYAHLAWLQLDWSVYNAANGETRPACGNLDDDNGDEICVGLGNGSGGWLRCFDDAAASYVGLSWLQLDWSVYNTAGGELNPALCDVDGDNRAEVVIGLGTGGEGWLEIKDDANAGYAHLDWAQVSWPSYNSSPGTTRPACGDVDGDGRDEVVVGLGTDSDGWVEIKDDAVAGYAHQSWVQTGWSDYNNTNGETFPACGDVDGDDRDEIVIGFGAGGEGWLEVKDDAGASYSHLGWPQLNWGAYNSANGETRPAVD